ncbi:MAG: hypothetical protein A2498_04545 [Lentisphaerae bacterium RIFOXYC12_FULL_60_16]|nr:MAG: hypothetical protein A2498_04545 [Lentisphaerae bacterium RIFOXYC12_FULL_60_16]OGV74267.1 MAG: hypothetical protein A2269_00500 [Lentisphaerae bacterium RIFOXYA12_FULL_60_10]
MRSYETKLPTLDALLKVREQFRRDKRVLVFTNGCFDILHTGHVDYLAFARNQGDALVVGLNSDASVRRLKGAPRPLVTQDDRARMLAALEAVDYVVLFDEDDPHRLIKTLAPDVLVKGQDYAPDQVVGHELVEATGGRVVLAPLAVGRSTTNLVNRIIASYTGPA